MDATEQESMEKAILSENSLIMHVARDTGNLIGTVEIGEYHLRVYIYI